MRVVMTTDMIAINAALITQITAAVKFRVRIKHFPIMPALRNTHTVVVTRHGGEITDSNQFATIRITAQESKH